VVPEANQRILNYYDDSAVGAEFRRRSVLPVEDDDHNGSGTSQIQIGPLRQAFILFIYVSGYTAGFGRFWMSAEKLVHADEGSGE
jgi:hypothetical protein